MLVQEGTVELHHFNSTVIMAREEKGRDSLVAPVLEEIQRKFVLGIDDPDK